MAPQPLHDLPIVPLMQLLADRAAKDAEILAAARKVVCDIERGPCRRTQYRWYAYTTDDGTCLASEHLARWPHVWQTVIDSDTEAIVGLEYCNDGTAREWAEGTAHRVCL